VHHSGEIWPFIEFDSDQILLIKPLKEFELRLYVGDISFAYNPTLKTDELASPLLLGNKRHIPIQETSINQVKNDWLSSLFLSAR
jgi:hypothetical protein